MRQLILTTILIFCLLNIHAQVLEVAGEISENTLWNADTIILTDHVMIADSVNLSIAAGTIVLAHKQKYLEIKGSLTAEGTYEHPILFSTFDTLGFSDTTTIDGTWGGLHFINLNEQSDSSILDYCIIEYGGAYGGEELDKRGGGIFIDQSSKIRVSNCIIQNNFAENGGGGIYLHENSMIKILNSIIRLNKTASRGGGIMSGGGSKLLIQKNLIIENLALRLEEFLPGQFGIIGEGGGVFLVTLDSLNQSVIKSNIICNNFSHTGAGIYEASFNTLVLSNIITNNYGVGIFAGNSISSSRYINNTIVNNQGAGITTFSRNINIINNIVHDNFFYFADFLIDTFDIRYKEGTPAASFRNNNVGTAIELEEDVGEEDLTGFGNGNINVRPNFVNPSGGHGLAYSGYEANWSLVGDDASIDAGTTQEILDILPEKDAYGNDRILGESIDIGAVEFDPINVVNKGFNNESVNIYPNPFSGQLWIETQDYQGQSWQLSVWNEHGQILHSFEVKHQISSINLSGWPSGLYFIEGKNKQGKQIFIKKVVKGK